MHFYNNIYLSQNIFINILVFERGLCTTKSLRFSFSATLTNSFLSMILTYLVIDKAFASAYNLSISFCFINTTFRLLKANKNISKIITTLMFGIKKIS